MSKTRFAKKMAPCVIAFTLAISFIISGCSQAASPYTSPLHIEEEIMPKLELSELGGDDKAVLFSYGTLKLGAIYDEISDYIKENGDYEGFLKFTSTNAEILSDRMKKPLDVNELPSLPAVVKKYKVPAEIVRNTLKTQNSYAQNEDDVYSDEEITAISEGNVERAFELMKGDYVIVKNGKVYVPGYIYNCDMSQLEKENITADELLSRSAIFEGVPLKPDQQTALQNKILKYAALKADKGELSGEYKISKYADYAISETIKNATFRKES